MDLARVQEVPSRACPTRSLRNPGPTPLADPYGPTRGGMRSSFQLKRPPNGLQLFLKTSSVTDDLLRYFDCGSAGVPAGL
jgi:hypothetical protein